jgi:hypothetical protein
MSDARRRSRRRVLLILVLAAVLLFLVGWTIRMFGVGGWYLAGDRLAFRFTAGWAALAALAIVVLALLCTHWAIRLSPDTPERPTAAELAGLEPAQRARRVVEFRRSGLKGLVVGADGRASTSQVQVAIWSTALGFGLLLLLLVGRTPNCAWAAAGPHTGSCPANPMEGVSFNDLLGSGFRWEYLLVLGWPVALAVTAKQQVLKALSQIDARTGALEDPTLPKAGSPEAVGTDPAVQVKTPATEPASIGVLPGLRDVVTDDRGRGALLDAQYFLFTLLTVGYFVLEIVTHPSRGLPQLPAALLVLMGIAGGGYLSGKVLDPLGAKSERGVPPPPATPATTEVPVAEPVVVPAAEPAATTGPARQEETVLIRVPPDPNRPRDPEQTTVIKLPDGG